MAVISDADRVVVWEDALKNASVLDPFVGLLKADIRAAVDAVDGWVNDNAVSFNRALPLTARTALTVKQKARLLALVITKRFERA